MKKRKTVFKKIMVVFMAICLTTVTYTSLMSNQSVVEASSYTDEIAELEKQAQKLQSTVNSLNSQISTAKKNKQSIMQQQKLLSQQRESLAQQIAIYNQKIELVDAQIKEKETDIANKEVEIAANEAEFAERVRAMYMANMSQSALTAVLTSDSFSSFLSRTEVLKRVSESDRNLIKELDTQKKELEEAKAEIVKTKEELVASKTSLANKEKELAASYAENQTTLTETEKAEKKYIEEMNKNAAAIKALNDQIDKIIAENTTTDGGYAATGKFIWPVPASHRITDKFGWRILYGKRNYHYGLDIPAAAGTSIVAADSGRVIAVNKSSTGYGWHIIIDHGNGYATLYGHCSRMDVKVGQIVRRGQVIAGVGTTGNSTGNHLHIGIKYNNVWQDPLKYISP